MILLAFVSGCRRVKELESQAMDFVTDVLFEGACSPDCYRGRFYPERQRIRNLITYVKMETRFSKIDQENVQYLYRHVEKPIFISHQGRKICSNLISIYVPLYLFIQLK